MPPRGLVTPRSQCYSQPRRRTTYLLGRDPNRHHYRPDYPEGNPVAA
jgi:hypothetical protein